MCLNNYVYQFHLNFLQAVSFNGYYFELQRIRNRYVLHSWCEFSNQIKSLLLSHCQETTHCNIKDKTCPVIGRHSVLQLIHPSHENFVREIHLIGCVVKKQTKTVLLTQGSCQVPLTRIAWQGMRLAEMIRKFEVTARSICSSNFLFI